jgi:rhamnosyl/mannosyltransferase
MTFASNFNQRLGRCLQLTKFYPPFNGGIETTARDISHGLSSRGWGVKILCSNTKAYTLYEAGNIPVRRVASLAHIASTSISPMMVIWLALWQSQSDVIHVHLPNPMANLALWVTRPRAKIVVHWHSDIVKQKNLLKFYEPIQDWLLKRSNAILVTSIRYAESSPWLQPHMHKVHIVPSCVEDPLLMSSLSRRQELTDRVRAQWPGKRIVFALGRMTYYKGFEVLINAARQLPDDVIVLIGGGGELLESLRERVHNAKLTGKVRLLGRISEDDLPGFFGAADLFCLPSLVRSEAFGLVLVEAMAYGRPVVATNIEGSGVPWVNLDGVSGLNAKPGDSASLAECIQRILNNPDLALKFGLGGRLRYESIFTIDKMVDLIEAAYESIGVTKI